MSSIKQANNYAGCILMTSIEYAKYYAGCMLMSSIKLYLDRLSAMQAAH